MRFYILFLILFISPALIRAQEVGSDKEKDAIKRVVETYLYAEEGEERKRTLFSRAKILSVDPVEGEVAETPISKKSPKRQGVRERSKQRIVFTDMTEGGAMVKVETELSSDRVEMPKHYHYLSLLKVSGEWKIVGILMPPIRPAVEAGNNGVR